MTANERKIKWRVQAIVVTAVAVFCGLVVTLVIQASIIGGQRNLEKRLLASQTELLNQIGNEEKMKNYYESERFLEEYALLQGAGRDGSTIFVK